MQNERPDPDFPADGYASCSVGYKYGMQGLYQKSFDYPVIQCKKHRCARWRFRTDQADQAVRQILPLLLSLGDPGW